VFSSAQESSRLSQGSETVLTGGNWSGKPTFFAVAQQLERDGLAQLLFTEGQKPKKRSRMSLAAATSPLWGVRLVDVASMSETNRLAMAQTLSQYKLTLDMYMTHYKVPA
jgi:hypothetical protein